jgi:seryl-tRNA synthetase
MLDPTFVRDHLDVVREKLAQRGAKLSAELEQLASLDTERRRLIPEVENLKREQNSASEAVARAKKAGEDVSHIFAANKARGQQIKQLEVQLEDLEAKRRQILLTIPNLPHDTVPVGASSDDNVEVRRCGTPRVFDFTPRPHYDLAVEMGILDFERAARMSGARFSITMGDGAKMMRALVNFMLDLHTREHGYTEIDPPYLVNAATLLGTGNLPKFEADLFKIAGDWDLYLVPTAEVPVTNLYRDEIVDGRQLPLRYTAYTMCFRSEAGSHGQDVRGLIRQHQFHKVELVSFAHPDHSFDELERMTNCAENVLRRLGLPFRTVLLCTGDMGFASAKTYDIEVWLPSQNTYREISSCSNTMAFQARRANIKFRPEGVGKAELLHTLNGSGVAVGRTFLAIVENFQERDGSIVIPEALRPFMGGQEVIEPRR